MPTSRRNLLTVAALSATGWPMPRAQAAQPAQANTATTLIVPDRLRDHLQPLFGDTAIPLANVTLALPTLAENGNSVALGITVHAPEPDTPGRGAHLTTLYVFAEKNPLPDIIRLEFPAPQTAQTLQTTSNSLPRPAADINTRVRLSDSQRIIAVAKYSDGSLAAGEASIVVTLAACIDLSE